ncbi:MAG: outer membrane lipoprotein carrier protein LolA [Bacteroidota bacterium]|nr:outer membrane lipoprotein carrier protein LolA [Bacteroidota bacterium]
MIKRILFPLALFIFSVQFATAQNNVQAEKVITDLLSEARTSAIRTNFKLIMSERKEAQPMVSSGTFTLKGTKFVLEMGAMKAWFDGKTQWAYVHQNNEVSITEPSVKELSETNPMAVLSGYKSKCLIRFSTKTRSAQNYCIEMIPKVRNNDITLIDVQVNKNNGNLFSIKLISKNGSTSLLTLSNFQKGINVPDNIFVFNAAKFKGVTVNDLR